jgi:hypothetical protein
MGHHDQIPGSGPLTNTLPHYGGLLRFTAPVIAERIVETFPWNTAPRSLLRDRDSMYSTAFQHRMKNIGSTEVKIAPRSPWQNPCCERLIGSICRDVLDHVIVLNELCDNSAITAQWEPGSR